MALGESQRRLVAWVNQLVFAGEGPPRAILLTGPWGVGKRTVASGVARDLGLRFIRVPVDTDAGSIRERLFGTAAEADHAANGGPPPGDLGNTSAVIYLDRFHSLDLSIASAVHQAVSQREYAAVDGRRYRLSDDLVLLAGLRVPAANARVSPEHFVCTAFAGSVTVSTPEGLELELIAAGILAEFDSNRQLAADIGPVLLNASKESDRFHSLSRWIRAAVEVSPDGALLDGAILQMARERDVQSYLSRLLYCGRTPTLDHFRRWQAQFPVALQPLAVAIVRLIAEQYYVSDERYHSALGTLVTNAKFQPNQQVVFCLWQPFGKSNPAVMYRLKNRSALRPAPHLDILDPNPAKWRVLTGGPPPTFVFTDDFIGSGQTVCDLWEKSPYRLPTLLDRYPGSRAIVLAVAGLNVGITRVRQELSAAPWGSRVSFDVAIEFDERDRCFADNSFAFPDQNQREELHKFCESLGRSLGLGTAFLCGYDDSQALVVFPDTVPNNSLPLLWHDQGNWIPLFQS